MRENAAGRSYGMNLSGKECSVTFVLLLHRLNSLSLQKRMRRLRLIGVGKEDVTGATQIYRTLERGASWNCDNSANHDGLTPDPTVL